MARTATKTGRPGKTGKTGLTGAQGVRGAIGPRGEIGKRGSTGLRGLRGLRARARRDDVLDRVVSHFEHVYQQLNAQMKQIARIQRQLDALRRD